MNHHEHTNCDRCGNESREMSEVSMPTARTATAQRQLCPSCVKSLVAWWQTGALEGMQSSLKEHWRAAPSDKLPDHRYDH